MPAGDAHAAGVRHGLHLDSNARRHREYGGRAAPRVVAREHRLDALGSPLPLPALLYTRRVGAVGDGVALPALERGVCSDREKGKEGNALVEGVALPALERGVGAGGDGCEEGALKEGERVVNRLEAESHDLPRLVLAHGRPLHLLAVAAPRMCKALAVAVVLCLEVGVGDDEVVVSVGNHIRGESVADGRSRCEGARDDLGALLPNIAGGGSVALRRRRSLGGLDYDTVHLAQILQGVAEARKLEGR